MYRVSSLLHRLLCLGLGGGSLSFLSPPSLFLLLLKLPDAFLYDVRPEVTLKVGQVFGRAQVAVNGVFEDVLGRQEVQIQN